MNKIIQRVFAVFILYSGMYACEEEKRKVNTSPVDVSSLSKKNLDGYSLLPGESCDQEIDEESGCDCLKACYYSLRKFFIKNDAA